MSDERFLSGIRILHLSRIFAGPFCIMMLGDLGAEVIKVERPGGGDDTRTWGPRFAGGGSAYYLCCNRKKKSITVDLTKPRGVELIKELELAQELGADPKTPSPSRLSLAKGDESAGEVQQCEAVFASSFAADE